MTRPPALGLVLAVATATRAAATAQTAASLDCGFAWVEYDHFLPSAAASLSPSLLLQSATARLLVRGTVLAFGSGNSSLQGVVVGGGFLPLLGGLRPELTVQLGGSAYREFVPFGHAVGRVRLHALRGPLGAWVGATAGGSTLGSGLRPVVAVDGGWWRRAGAGTVTLAARSTAVGDTTYVDVEGVGHWGSWAAGSLELDLALGARLLSRGGGSGVYGEATATIPLSATAALVLAGGRYPTDVPSGSIAGRYLSAVIRVRAPPRSDGHGPAYPRALPANPAGADDGAAPAAVVAVHSAGAGRRTLVVYAPGAGSVELMGDFTDWRPVALERRRAGAWEVTLAITPGLRRVNVRVNGGRWEVPAGATPAADDFGAPVGLLVVP